MALLTLTTNKSSLVKADIRVAVHIEKLLDQRALQEAGSPEELQAVIKAATTTLRDFIRYWHSLENKADAKVPEWLVYIFYLPEENVPAKAKA